MARRPTHDIAVGTIFALGLVILSVAVMSIGTDLPWLSQRVSFKVLFPNTDGLMVGAPVRMAGVDIGSVTSIRLPTDPEVLGIEIELSVLPRYSPRVRSDSSAALRILQLLTNEKYVEITPGNSNQPELPSGATAKETALPSASLRSARAVLRYREISRPRSSGSGSRRRRCGSRGA